MTIEQNKIANLDKVLKDIKNEQNTVLEYRHTRLVLVCILF